MPEMAWRMRHTMMCRSGDANLPVTQRTVMGMLSCCERLTSGTRATRVIRYARPPSGVWRMQAIRRKAYQSRSQRRPQTDSTKGTPAIILVATSRFQATESCGNVMGP